MPNLTANRIVFIDALRGLAIVLMVLNHSALYLLDSSLDPFRHYLVYITVSLSAPLFLLLVGFSLSLSFYRSPQGVSTDPFKRYWKYIKRAVVLIVVGYLLNGILKPDEPIYSGGILQTIGLSIILISPGLYWLQHQKARDIFLLLAFTLYLLFVYAQPGLGTWMLQNPVLTDLFFNGFPPWPWICFVLIGVVLGYEWLETGNQVERTRLFIKKLKLISFACLAIYFITNGLQGGIVNFNLHYDYIINGHWLPNGTTVFWSLGMCFLLMTIMQYIFTKQYQYTQWLVVLGQAALILYVLHLVLIIGFSDRLFELHIVDWRIFILFNMILILSFVMLSNRLKRPLRSGR